MTKNKHRNAQLCCARARPAPWAGAFRTHPGSGAWEKIESGTFFENTVGGVKPHPTQETAGGIVSNPETTCGAKGFDPT